MNKRLLVTSGCIVLIICLLCTGGIGLLVESKVKKQENRQDKSTAPEPATPQEPEPEQYHGVSLSPKSFSPGDFVDFFELASKTGNAVTWAGPWDDLTDNNAPATVSELAEQYDYEPIILISPIKDQSSLIITDKQIEAQMIAATTDFVARHDIKYLGVGVEVNIIRENNPEAYQKLTILFKSIYQAVKAESPETQIFTVFQLERMKGLQGGLFGGKNDTGKLNQWSLINDFPDADLIAFTTYPCLIYKSPGDIPVNYYSEILAKTTKPIAFTEIGWFRTGVKGWESSAEEQAEFISRYYSLNATTNPKLEIWSFLYDPTAGPDLFRTVGLLSPGQNTSAPYLAWKQARR